MSGWIGVDLDRTLAVYDEFRGANHIGAPIPLMVDRVKEWLSQGIEVRILTARASSKNPERHIAIKVIQAWCLEHIGVALEVTAEKDFDMWQIWDDRAIQVVPNTGELVAEE